MMITIQMLPWFCTMMVCVILNIFFSIWAILSLRNVYKKRDIGFENRLSILEVLIQKDFKEILDYLKNKN